MDTTNSGRSILVSEYDPLLRKLIQTTLETRGHSHLLESMEDERGVLASAYLERCSLLVVDGDRAKAMGLALLRALRKMGHRTPVILLGRRLSSATLLTALGPVYALPKPFCLKELRTALDWALPASNPPSKTATDIHQGHASTVGGSSDILWVPDPRGVERPRAVVARSPAMKAIVQTIQNVAKSEATTLFLGPSGTGKTLLAGLMHHLSPRRSKPFVVVNSRAVPDGLLMDQLFGHEKGAFTGAESATRGKCEQADGGTLFLDEVANLTESEQVGILRFLQDRQFERLGSEEARRSDARVIVATHHDLERMACEGRFREDLYYRLKVAVITVPPLCEHLEDVPLLVETALEELARRNKFPRPELDPRTLEFLFHYSWPGNTRGLWNTLERMVVLPHAGIIRVEDLGKYLDRPLRPHGPHLQHRRPAPRHRDLSKEDLTEALIRSNGNTTQASVMSGISRRHFIRLKKKHGIS